MEKSKYKISINFGFSGDHPFDMVTSEMYDVFKQMGVPHRIVHDKKNAIWTVEDAIVTLEQRKQLEVHAENLGCLVTRS